ncbi:MAG: response regulator, partial [Bacteroidales bacterium]|nr:response regulator [Bacteroidales bacterium]
MPSAITTIIVDDEPNSRDMIDFLLKSSDDVKVLDKCENITQAFESIKQHNPDIIFLDIEMPGGSGFDLLQMLRNTPYNPTVVFITAYNQFAIKAIK